jgi:hypothetical protein
VQDLGTMRGTVNWHKTSLKVEIVFNRSSLTFPPRSILIRSPCGYLLIGCDGVLPGDDQEIQKPKLQANLLLYCRSGDDGVASVSDENLRANLRQQPKISILHKNPNFPIRSYY